MSLPNKMSSLTNEQKSIIKCTAPILAKEGANITLEFYKTLLNEHPQLKHIFSHSAQTVRYFFKY